MAAPGTQNVNVPVFSYETRQADIDRRMKLAQALQESGQAEQPEFSYRGIVAPMSPLSGLAKALQLGLGAYRESSAYEDQRALTQEMTDRDIADKKNFIAMFGGNTVPGTAAVLPNTPNASAGEPQQYPGADRFAPLPQNVGTPSRTTPGDPMAAFTALAASPLPNSQNMGVQGVIAEGNAKRVTAAELAKEERTQTNALALEAAKSKLPDKSTDIKNYEYALTQGYNGTFWQFQNEQRTQQFDPNVEQKKTDYKLKIDKYEQATTNLEAADSILTDVQQMSEYVNQVDSGALADTKLAAQKLIRSFGFSADEDAISNAEALRAKSMDFILKRVQQTKGAISNAEMTSFKNASPGLGTTPEGNRKILKFFSNVAERMKMESEAVRQAYMENPNISFTEMDSVKSKTREKFGKILLEEDSTSQTPASGPPPLPPGFAINAK